MKKLKFIYNPFSGDKSIKIHLDDCINIFQQYGYDVDIYRAVNRNGIDELMKNTPIGFYDLFVVSGGDGSVNIFINSLIKYGHENTPIGIIPAGTANDFATFLKIPKTKVDACKFICENKPHHIDIGTVKSKDSVKYFINVCAGGLFANVSQTVDKHFKDIFGKLAYYVKGLEEMKNFAPLKMRITNSKEVIEENICLFLVLNSSGTGGINNISPEASVQDGLFDFVAIKDTPLSEIGFLVHKFFSGDYLTDKNIIFFRDSNIKIENLSDDIRYLETDVDGECGPQMPVEVYNEHKKIKVIINEKG